MLGQDIDVDSGICKLGTGNEGDASPNGSDQGQDDSGTMKNVASIIDFGQEILAIY